MRTLLSILTLSLALTLVADRLLISAGRASDTPSARQTPPRARKPLPQTANRPAASLRWVG